MTDEERRQLARKMRGKLFAIKSELHKMCEQVNHFDSMDLARYLWTAFHATADADERLKEES